jgi:hypothetical protein
LKLLDGSAERSISARDSVCNGSFFGNERRACKADSFADERAASGGGEGKFIGSNSCRVSSDELSISFSIISTAGDVDCERVLAKLN